VATLMGRKRRIPELSSPNKGLREFGERMAVNTPIQGAAADLIKLAMIAIQRELIRHEFKSAMIIQVHDELVFDILDSEKEEVSGLVRREMEQAAKLCVPLKVKLGIGETWYRE